MITVIGGNPEYNTSIYNIETSEDLNDMLGGVDSENYSNGDTAQYYDGTELRVFYFNNGSWGEL